MKKEKETCKKNLKLEKTPKKAFNTEGNKNITKIKPFYPNNLNQPYTINKRKNKIQLFNNNKISFSVDKKINRNLPSLNNVPILLTKNKKEWSNLELQNKGNIYDNLNYNNLYERDNLLMQIYHTQNDMNKTNKEIKELKKLFTMIEKENMANKYLISQLLNKNKSVKVESNNNTIENNEKPKKSENNNIINNNIGSKKQKKKFDDNDQTKIDRLIKGIKHYDKCLSLKEKELSYMKKRNETKEYGQINELLEQKNKILEDLIKNYNDIKSKINVTDEQIINMSLKIYNLHEISAKKTAKISYYKKETEEIEYKIKYLEEQKIKLEKNEKKLEEQKKEEEEEINNLINEEKKLEEEYEQNKKYKIEKNQYETEISNSYNNEKNYKRKYEMNLRRLEKCEASYKQYTEKINNYEKERDNLMEKSKIPQKNREKMKEMENEIYKLEKEIEKYDKKKIKIEEKIQENNEKIEDEINNNKKEFENYQKEIEELTKKIKQLNDEFKSKNDNKIKKENELNTIIKKYEEIKNNSLNREEKNSQMEEKEENNDVLEKENSELKEKNKELKTLLEEMKSKNKEIEGILEDFNKFKI